MKKIEHLYYAHTLGIDYVDGEYRVYAQILNFATLGKTEGGTNGDDPSAWVGKGTGESLQAAFHHLYATTQRRIYWDHLISLVLSESLLKQGIDKVLDRLTRFNELRYTFWIFGTQENIEEILLVSPIFENTPAYSRIGDPKDVYDQSSFIEPIRFYRFISTLREPGKTVLFPMVTSTKTQWADEKKKLAAIEFAGVGMLSSDAWGGWLPKHKSLGVRWLNKHTSRTPLTIYEKNKSIANLILEHPKSKITVEIRNENVCFNIKVKVRASIADLKQNVTMSMLQSEAEQAIADQIRQTYREGLQRKVDVLNLMHSLYRSKPQLWNQITDNNAFNLDEDSLSNIDVKVKISNRGMTVEPF